MPDIAERSSITLYEEDGEIVVIPRDNDKFVVTKEDAVRACRAIGREIRCGHQIEALIERLSAWIGERKERIRSAHLTVRESDILFLVMQRQVEFDQELVDALTELDLEVANSVDFDLVKFNVLSIPPVTSRS